MLVELEGFLSAEFFITVDNDIDKRGLVLHEQGPSPKLLAGDERAAGSPEEVQYDVVCPGTSPEGLVMKARGFGCRMLVFLGGQPFCEPDVEVVVDIVEGTVSGSDFLVQDLMEGSLLGRDIRLAPRSIHARLVGFVEGNARGNVDVVLDP